MLLAPAPISSRNQFGELLNSLNLTRDGVEIGTHRGEFAAILLRKWMGRLSCIDPWSIPVGYEDQAKGLHDSKSRREDYDHCRRVLESVVSLDKYRLMMATSENAVKHFADESLDFVYIDGDHRMEEVYRDLALWYPKLLPGGMMAGHDIICPGEVGGGWAQEIQPALFEFIRYLEAHGDEEDVMLHLVVEENGLPWSFYFLKERGNYERERMLRTDDTTSGA